jgi:hypothetical protein
MKCIDIPLWLSYENMFSNNVHHVKAQLAIKYENNYILFQPLENQDDIEREN